MDKNNKNSDLDKRAKPERTEVKPMSGRNFVSVKTTHSFKGPLPPPEMLGAYEQIFGGCAERIVALTEGQSKHRQKQEERMVIFSGVQRIMAPILAFLVIIAGFIIGAYLVLQGKEGYGLFTGIAPLGTVAAIFFYQDDEKRKKK